MAGLLGGPAARAAAALAGCGIAGDEETTGGVLVAFAWDADEEGVGAGCTASMRGASVPHMEAAM